MLINILQAENTELTVLASDNHIAHPKEDAVAAIESTDRRELEKKEPT